MNTQNDFTKLLHVDFTSKSLTELVDVWRQNHQLLLSQLMSDHPPFFGLHGTTKSNLDSILQQKKGYFNMATFYDKERSEKRLYQLYDMCLYVSGYGFVKKGHEAPGGILLFNLDDGKENITLKWEHLLAGNNLSICSSFDKPDEKKFFGMLNDHENLLWRTDEEFNTNSFNNYYLDVITFEEVADYFLELNCGMDSFPKNVVRSRHLSQFILYESLNILEQNKLD